MNTPTFNHHATDDMNRTQHRPLGALSAYAAIGLGDDLKAIAANTLSTGALAEQCATLSTDALQQLPLLMMKEDLAIAHLDTMMLPQALKTIGREMPPELRDLIRSFHTKDPEAVPMLTYEDIVLQNPSEDPRTFTRDEVGNSELFFYDIHRRIEQEMTQLRDMLFEMLSNQTGLSFLVASLSKEPPQKQVLSYEVEDCCLQMLPHLSNVRESMQLLLDELDPSHFTAFRPYFIARNDPDYGLLPGPSGNYSAGMYCFDSLCIGRQPLLQELHTSKDAEFRFFPRTVTVPNRYETQAHMKVIKKYIDMKGFTLDDCSVDYARESCIRVMDAMREIRESHLELFKKFIGSGPGSALKLPPYLELAPRAYAQAIADLQ